MKKSYINAVKSICDKYAVDFDLVDIQEFDSSLELQEFKGEVEDFVCKLSESNIGVKANELTREDLYQIEEDKLATIKKSIQLKLTKVSQDKDYFFKMKQYVSMVAKKHTNNLIITGVGGIGKSYQVIQRIKELGLKENEDYITINGYMTPLKFYERLYENRDKLVILDDVAGLLNNLINVAILKGMMWEMGNNKRIVTYNSSTAQLQYVGKFEFTGQLIVILNKIDKEKDVHTKALLSRAIHYTLEFAFKDIKEILRQISKSIRYKNISIESRTEVTDYILNNTDETTKDLNIRSLIKAFDIYLYANSEHLDWKPLVLELFNRDENLVALKEILDEYSSRKDQIDAYKKLRNRSRRNFYDMLKKIGD
jgi:hypothetical protein